MIKIIVGYNKNNNNENYKMLRHLQQYGLRFSTTFNA